MKTNHNDINESVITDVNKLIDVYTSLSLLMQDMLSVSIDELHLAVSWDSELDPHAVIAVKEALINEEATLNKHRIATLASLSESLGLTEPSVRTILSVLSTSDAHVSVHAKLSGVIDELFSYMVELDKVNAQLRIVYSTNSRLVKNLMSELGISSLSDYEIAGGKRSVQGDNKQGIRLNIKG